MTTTQDLIAQLRTYRQPCDQTMLHKAADALEAFQAVNAQAKFSYMDGYEGGKQEARDAALAQLAATEKQEPVGYVLSCGDLTLSIIRQKGYYKDQEMALFAAAGASPQLEALQAEVADLTESRDFYKRRVDLLQQWQSKMRDPERAIACDIVANGQTLPPENAGDRYTVAAGASPQPAATKQSPHHEYDKGFSDGWNRCEERQAAQPVQPASNDKHWCETCDGGGTIDETLGGEHFSNPKAECPDCDGNGYWIRRSQPVQPSQSREFSDAEIVGIAKTACAAGRLCWLGFNKDEDGRYTVPALSPSDFQLVREVIAAINAKETK